MSELYLSITPHDPLIARDARPFGLGINMKSLDWPYPSVLAGSVRTMLGKMNSDDFDPETVAALKQVSVGGPLPLCHGSLYLPAPADILLEEKEDGTRWFHPLRPAQLREEEGCNHPNEGLLPTMLPDSVEDEFKPQAMPPFWSIEKMTAWLACDRTKSFDLPKKEKNEENNRKEETVNINPPDVLDFPEKESRTHVSIESSSGIAIDGMLFETIGLDFGADGMQIAARVDTKDFVWKNSLHPLGGERRLVYWRAETVAGWQCPEEIQDALMETQYVRMVLATPGVFAGGWLPGWIDEETLEGRPPGAPGGVTLRLISASVGRWKPLSGWSLEKGKGGPKPIRRLVPAGSVYFFEVIEGDPAALAEQFWLRPVSDTMGGLNYGCDGFGLALWGAWNGENVSQTDKNTEV